MLAVLTRYLAGWGEAASGRATSGRVRISNARDAVRSKPRDFDLIVTDYTMPGLTGFDLARAALRCNPDLGVVITSGYRLGADDTSSDFIYLGKPFTSSALAIAVEHAASTSVIAS